MSTTLEESLYTAAVYTFEQLVFMLPEVPPDEIQRRKPVTAVARISFSGPACGQLQLHAGEGLLPRIAANMMGVETSPVALQLDALGEIANIICGQVLPTINSKRAFEQKPPEVVACVPGVAASELNPSARIELGLDASRADLLLYLYSDSSQGSK